MITEPLIADIFMALIIGLVGIIFGYQRYLHHTMEAVRDELKHLEVKIASDHLTKDELREMFKELEQRFSQQITFHFNALKRDIRK